MTAVPKFAFPSAADRLRSWAKEAIKQYTADLKAGGEVAFPIYAHDVLELLDEIEVLKAQINQAKSGETK